MRSTRAAGTLFFCIKIIDIIIIIQHCNYRHRYRHTALQNRDDNHQTFTQYDSRVYVNGHLFSFLFLFFSLIYDCIPVIMTLEECEKKRERKGENKAAK